MFFNGSDTLFGTVSFKILHKGWWVMLVEIKNKPPFSLQLSGGLSSYRQV
jgi:hypothetical protein